MHKLNHGYKSETENPEIQKLIGLSCEKLKKKSNCRISVFQDPPVKYTEMQLQIVKCNGTI